MHQHASRQSDSADGSRPVLAVHLWKEFPAPVGKLLDNFAIRCREGEIIALLGMSGCGKTTILNLIAGLPPTDPGDQSSVAEPANERNSVAIGFAFQRPNLLPWRDSEGNAYHEAEVLGMDGPELDERVEELLRITRLSEYRHLYPDELSVGMQQRLQFVRVLACPRAIMLLDEPLGAVDQPLRLRIAEAARSSLKAGGAACLWVTHDSLEAVTVADTVLVLGGRPLQVVLRHEVRRIVDEEKHGVDGATPLVATPLLESSVDGQAATLRRHLLDATMVPETLPTMCVQPPRPNKGKSWRWRPLSLVLPLLPIVALLLLWEVVVAIRPGLRFYVSAPSEWLPLLFQGLLSGVLLDHLVITLYEAGLGLALGGPAGVLAGFGAAHSPKISAATRPVLVGMSAVPLFVLAPAFILWFGIGPAMKVAIAALSAFPFVAYMTHDGALEAKGTYYRYLKAKAKPGRLFTTLVVPSTLEGIIESLRPAAVAALIGAFLGEFIAANEGLGYFIILQASRYHVAEVFAGVSLLFVIAVAMDWLCRKAGQHRHKLVALGRGALGWRRGAK